MNLPNSNPSTLGGGIPGQANKLPYNTIAGSYRSQSRSILRRAWGGKCTSASSGTTCTGNLFTSVSSTGSIKNKSESSRGGYAGDAGDYIRYKRLVAQNKNYNDKANGGSNSGAQSALARVRR